MFNISHWKPNRTSVNRLSNFPSLLRRSELRLIVFIVGFICRFVFSINRLIIWFGSNRKQWEMTLCPESLETQNVVYRFTTEKKNQRLSLCFFSVVRLTFPSLQRSLLFSFPDAFLELIRSDHRRFLLITDLFPAALLGQHKWSHLCCWSTGVQQL